MSWLIPTNQLTPDQSRAVRLSPSEHRLISGGPGSGKTQILVHRAKYLLDQLNISADKWKIIVYTNVLKDYIKSDTNLLDLPEDNVHTFDHWCRLFYEAHIGPRVPFNHKTKRPDFEAARRAVSDYIDTNISKPFFEFLLIDEGQDLPKDAFELLNKISNHVTVCFDKKQQLYSEGCKEQDVLEALNIIKKNINLIDAFRVCPYLVKLAAQFVPDKKERAAFLDQQRTPQVEKETPLLYFARDFNDENSKLYEMVRERQLMNERIAILLATNKQVGKFAQGLRDVGIEVEVPKSQSPHDFTSSRPKLMTFHSAKGLTFDSVLLPRLVPRSFSWLPEEKINTLIFMAITRATRWAYFSTQDGDSLHALKKIIPLEKSGELKLLNWKDNSRKEKAPKSSDDDLDFL
jgi:superfamily I DNA/RNA helicase